MELDKLTLNEVEALLRRGQITPEQAQEYCDKWNTGTFRFTNAQVVGNRIFNQIIED